MANKELVGGQDNAVVTIETNGSFQKTKSTVENTACTSGDKIIKSFVLGKNLLGRKRKPFDGASKQHLGWLEPHQQKAIE